MIPATATTISPRPMGDVNFVMRDLDIDSDKVRALVDEGRLIAFNISTQQTDRPDLRILAKSVEHYKENGWKRPLILEWPEIFRLIMPHEKPFLRRLEMERSLNCSPMHIINLVHAGKFEPVKKPRAGITSAFIVTRVSFENFLKKRLQ